MTTAQLVNTGTDDLKEFSSRTYGAVMVGQVTTDGSGDAHINHPHGRAAFAACAIDESGAAWSATLAVTSDTTKIVIAGGGATVRYTVIAFF